MNNASSSNAPVDVTSHHAHVSPSSLFECSACNTGRRRRWRGRMRRGSLGCRPRRASRGRRRRRTTCRRPAVGPVVAAAGVQRPRRAGDRQADPDGLGVLSHAGFEQRGTMSPLRVPAETTLRNAERFLYWAYGSSHRCSSCRNGRDGSFMDLPKNGFRRKHERAGSSISSRIHPPKVL